MPPHSRVRTRGYFIVARSAVLVLPCPQVRPWGREQLPHVRVQNLRNGHNVQQAGVGGASGTGLAFFELLVSEAGQVRAVCHGLLTETGGDSASLDVQAELPDERTPAVRYRSMGHDPSLGGCIMFYRLTGKALSVGPCGSPHGNITVRSRKYNALSGGPANTEKRTKC